MPENGKWGEKGMEGGKKREEKDITDKGMEKSVEKEAKRERM